LKKLIKKIVVILLPIVLGVFLIWWSLSSLSDADKTEIQTAFKNVNYFWIFISLFLGLLSHLSRAYRWKFLLEPLGYKPKFLNSVFTIFTAYLVNLFLPRAGEVARATGISKYEAIPFEKAFGTIVAERIIDVIMLLIIIVLAFFYQFDLLADLVAQKIPKNPLNTILILALLFAITLGVYYLIKKSKQVFFVKIRGFIKGLLDGIKSVLSMKKRGAFIAHTIFIWLMYLLMFYTASFSLQETAHLSMGAVITGFVVGALSIATTNGGLGTYPIGVQRVLNLYGVALNPALAFGWIMWSAQTFMILLFGGISLLIIPLYNRKFLKL
jgi:uncharacterized protein (TIRG00374 family)